MILHRSAILSQTTLPRLEVKIPEWNGTVFVRAMTAGERDQFEAEQLRLVETKQGHRDIRARMAVATVCDGQGQLFFTAADLPAVSALQASALDRIFAAATKLNALSTEDVEALKKTSSNGQDDGSSSDWPSPSAEPWASSNRRSPEPS